VADHDRPLNARGRRDAPFIGSWVRKNVPFPPGRPPMAMVSTAKRAQLTWSLACNGFDDLWRGCETIDEARIYEAGLRGLVTLIADVPEDVHTALLVGHNPGLVDLIGTVCAEDETFLRATEKFPTSSIAVLETTGPWSAVAESGRPFAVGQFMVARAQPQVR
jgi:phosphohistidine phosphatase